MFRNRIFNALSATVLMVVFLAGQSLAVPPGSVAYAQAATITFDNMTQVSPDGQHMVYVTAQDAGMHASSIWVANADGSQASVLVAGDNPGNSFWVTDPVWSPDSQQIAYVKAVQTGTTTLFVNYRYELWAIGVDGSNNRLLTDSAFSPALGYGGRTDLDWNDSNQLVFSSGAAFPPQYYTLDMTTLAVTPVASSGGPQAALPNSVSLNVTSYLQADPAWANDVINYQASCDDGTPRAPTIGNYGSAITAAAMAINTQLSDGFDPGSLNQTLTENGGYDGCGLIFDYLSNMPGLQSALSVDTTYNVQSNPDLSKMLAMAKTEAAGGVPVLLWYYEDGINTDRNFVVVTGYNSLSGSLLNVNDPKVGPRTLDFFDPTYPIQGMVILQPAGYFSKIAPASNTGGVDPTNVTLNWNTLSPTQDSYVYCIHANGQCAANDWTNAPQKTQVTLPPLQANTQYYWQVEAKVGSSPVIKTQANGGQWWTFTTKNGPSITISGNAGVQSNTPTTTVTYTGTGANVSGTVQTNNGDYSITVPWFWSGTVTPSRSPTLIFSPASQSYTNLTTNQTGQNYTASASMSGNAGVGGVTLTYNGTLWSGTTQTDGSGNYSLSLPPFWAGTVVPSLACYTFSPASRNYTNVNTIRTGENYIAAHAGPETISGSLVPPVVGAVLTYSGALASGTTTANPDGTYSINVPCNWSGTITPALAGYTFQPASMTYASLQANKSSQDYVTHPNLHFSGNVATTSGGLAGVDVLVTDNSVGTTDYFTDSLGNYAFVEPYNWTGTIMVLDTTAYTFVPNTRTFTNITTDQTGLNVAATYIAPPPPMTFYSTGANDGWILETSPNSNIGGQLASNQNIDAGDNAAQDQYRSILSFDTSTLPPLSKVVSAVLKIKLMGVVGTNPFSWAKNFLRVDIKTGTFGALGLEPSDFQATADYQNAGTIPNTPVDGWYSSTLVAPLVNTQGITQLRLRFSVGDNNDSVADFLRFYPGENATYAPELIVTYILPPPFHH